MDTENESSERHLRNSVAKAANIKSQSGLHMSAENEANISSMLQNIGAPPTRPRSPREILEANHDDIRIALEAGWTAAGICEKLKAFGVNIKASTFNVYWRQIQSLPPKTPRLASPENFTDHASHMTSTEERVGSGGGVEYITAPVTKKFAVDAAEKGPIDEVNDGQLGLFNEVSGSDQ